jgi:hypothetical protein
MKYIIKNILLDFHRFSDIQLFNFIFHHIFNIDISLYIKRINLLKEILYN